MLNDFFIPKIHCKWWQNFLRWYRILWVILHHLFSLCLMSSDPATDFESFHPTSFDWSVELLFFCFFFHFILYLCKWQSGQSYKHLEPSGFRLFRPRVTVSGCQWINTAALWRSPLTGAVQVCFVSATVRGEAAHHSHVSSASYPLCA